jgi:1-acyl-sn-glycerol-3-phosphate acyltransferase
MDKNNKSSADVLKRVKFQKGVYRFCLFVIGPFVKKIFRFKSKPCKVKSKTFLALGNHTQDLDPALLVIGTKKYMKFVANASLTKGVSGFFLNNLFGIIPREKGASGEAVIALIEKNLKAGVPVGMFPEGNKTWDGETEFISKRTAKLAKESGAALITYKFTGGYLLKPRWASFKRKGPMYGELVNEYSAEQLASMSEEEVYQAMCDDLYVNAYIEQQKTGDLYIGKNLAEGFEYAAYLCPKCEQFGTITSSGNEISCNCGLTAIYNDKGRIESNCLNFDTLIDWNRFQKKWLNDNSSTLKLQIDRPIVKDKYFSVVRIENGVYTELSNHASLAMFGNRIEISFQNSEQLKENEIKTNQVQDQNNEHSPDGQVKIVYPLSQVSGFGLFRQKSIYFNCENQNNDKVRYQLLAHHKVSGLKYYALWRVLTDREYL